MLNSIWEDIRREFNYGNMVTRLVIVNVAVFVAVNVLRILLFLFNAGTVPPIYQDILHFFCLSSDWLHNLTHPWVLVTSMFLHEGFWHVLWNMLFLYWFGRIVGDFLGNHRILPLYLLGGLVGALFFFLSANFLPVPGFGNGYALGASAAVMAIVVASGAIAPDYIIRLLFLGDVKLKYIVAVLVFLDLIGLASDFNTGGHFAHLGGAFFGWFFIYQLRNGNDLTKPVLQLFDWLEKTFREGFSTKRKPRMAYKNPKVKVGSAKGGRDSDPMPVSHQEKLDSILDKIKESGYESLSAEEKEFLFKASKD